MKKNEFRAEPVSCSVKPLSFCQELCIGCNQCASVCQVDIMIPSPEKGKHPIVMYPGECYYCGSCSSMQRGNIELVSIMTPER